MLIPSDLTGITPTQRLTMAEAHVPAGSRLPNEILAKIFSYLKPGPEDEPFEPRKDLAMVSLCSKRFRAVGQELIYRDLIIGDESMRRSLIRSLVRHPELGGLVRTLQDYGDTSWVYGNTGRLGNLDLTRVNASGQMKDRIMRGLRVNDLASTIALLVLLCPNLLHLDLTLNPEEDNELTLNLDLIYLVLQDGNLSQESRNGSVLQAGHLSKLTSLRLESWFAISAQVLDRLPNLSRLSIQNAVWPQGGTKPITKTPKLEHLDLERPRLRPGQLVTIIASMPKLDHIQVELTSAPDAINFTTMAELGEALRSGLMTVPKTLAVSERFTLMNREREIGSLQALSGLKHLAISLEALAGMGVHKTGPWTHMQDPHELSPEVAAYIASRPDPIARLDKVLPGSIESLTLTVSFRTSGADEYTCNQISEMAMDETETLPRLRKIDIHHSYVFLDPFDNPGESYTRAPDTNSWRVTVHEPREHGLRILEILNSTKAVITGFLRIVPSANPPTLPPVPSWN